MQHFLYFLPLPHGHGSLRPAVEPFASAERISFAKPSMDRPVRTYEASRRMAGRAWVKNAL